MQKRIVQCVTVTMMVIMPLVSWCASFNCAKASTRTEKMICSNDGISKADESLAKTYKSALATTQDKATLKQQQKDWLKKRDAVTNEAAMLLLYQERITQLSGSGAINSTDHAALQPFPHLNKFVGAGPDEVLKDKIIQNALKKLLGKHFKDLDIYLNVSEGVSFNSVGALEMEGCMAHNCMGNAAKIYIQKNGQIYVGILDNNKVLYFTNDKYYKDKPITSITNFAKEKEATIVLAK